MTREIITSSPEETFEFGVRFAAQLQPSNVVTFVGDLGAGKTTCIRGICRGLGVTDHITSPTFTLINEYEGCIPVYHFDFYRLQDSGELGDLGLEEYFEKNGIFLIEWPAVAVDLLPPRRYEMRLSWDFSADHPNSRKLILTEH
ncbi:MAG: tRNA (adenosine(37)-N6)-threonylcarbamoyltransferase complex ATPase subunit type 1 TsaE [candidate division KSB1 bacterium]|nr:tRNA (adenosine(37)-N6)-threonylcarbamoyltransferase complex ATPase subunit type 1 TsaE [candidate division KSB1 bacterium]